VENFIELAASMSLKVLDLVSEPETIFLVHFVNSLFKVMYALFSVVGGWAMTLGLLPLSFSSVKQ
jgi:hypothetical protein